MSPLSSSSKPETYRARITTQPHLLNRSKKVTTCFVLNDHSNSATYTDRDVPSSTEPIEQMLSTSTGCVTPSAIDTKIRSILDDHAADNAERPRLGERGYEPGWNTRFEKEAHRGKLYGSKQDVSLFRTKGVQEDTPPEGCVIIGIIISFRVCL